MDNLGIKIRALSGALVVSSHWNHPIIRAPDKERIFISKMSRSISSPNPMFDHLLESSHRDDSNKGSNMGFGE